VFKYVNTFHEAFQIRNAAVDDHARQPHVLADVDVRQ